MEPRIQYAKTSDGVNIAYAVLGEGPAIVYLGGGFGDIHTYSSGVMFRTQATDTLVGLGRRVIMHDSGGTGSSDRNNLDYSLECRLRDVEAVIERTVGDRFALWCIGQGGPTGIAYAAMHPERVSHIVLVATCARIADWYKVPALRAARALETMVEEEWEYYTLQLAHATSGFTDSETANRWAEVIRSGMSPNAYLAWRNAGDKIDVTELLTRVNAPTLVMHVPQVPLSNIDFLRVLASEIPNARLERLTSPEEVARAIDVFLREGETAAAAPTELPSGTAIILFADIADSTALTERLGDATFRAKARGLDGALRAIIRENAGTPIEGKLLGDGVLAVFTSARQAIEAALACATAGNDGGLPLHLGLHAGDVIREKDPDGRANVYGGAVNIAARIAGASAAGEVLVSDIVRGLARTSAGVTFEDRGEHALKGIAEPQRIFAVRRE